ncbi:hypothetical protein EST38_g12659 [Candolleomyces aberdarensis]|uniref:Uncharacterized protein n=1 Tax=Candolleomyces aberdarensis TaxID=2316362 RepID=A0A4Q2D4D0_9AGAR|nr:hypothetical protein EST38_g12659 [Candolleomyces aberdarensis]
MVKQMSYRHNYKSQADPIEDLYDGKIYQSLCQTKVTIGDAPSARTPYKIRELVHVIHEWTYK